MNKNTVASMKAHAEAAYPNESCGLVIAGGKKDRYVPCRNKAEDGNHFIMDAEDYANAEDVGQVLAIVHSHPDGPEQASEGDKVACEASGLPWLIVIVKDGAATGVTRIEPDGYQPPLIGRQFFHGVLDCYTLVQDVYQRELGITLPHFDRENGWWEGEQELYLDNFGKAGFREVTDGSLKPYDVILMQRQSERANHAGVFLGTVELKEAPHIHPVPDAMLHHSYGRLSERVVYGGYWKQITRMVIRYDR
ncbi:MAG: C40 family peptidase [Parvibaculaceae bacterium]|nr:C40 family peptidase [Parvibaculaceae bacterium]